MTRYKKIKHTLQEEKNIQSQKNHTHTQVPKGFIAVRDTLYKKIEVKGKGGGGKVYKVSRF
jgi:hypothetical protein